MIKYVWILHQHMQEKQESHIDTINKQMTNNLLKTVKSIIPN